MKKLLGIVVLGLLLSGNAYAEIITLDCKSLMEETPQNLRYQTIKINTKEKYIFL